MARDSVRVALQSGAASIDMLKAMAVLSLFGTVAIGFLTAASAPVTAKGIGVFLLLFVAWGIYWALRTARQRRASDLVVDADGLRIAGGAGDGARFAWSDIAAVRIVEDRLDSTTTTVLNRTTTEYRHDLVFVDGAGATTVVAQSLDPREKASLDDIAGALDAARTRRAEEPGPEPDAPKPTIADVVTCAACGAPVAPADAAEVTCHACGKKTAMPATIRRRLGSAAGTAASTDRTDDLVTQLFDQPPAAPTNTRLTLFAAAFFAAPLVLVGTGRGAPLALGLVALAWGWAGRAVAHRVALRSMVLGFAARTPAAEGHPYGCRRCGAPLPAPSGERIVVSCVYCSTDNVVGIEDFGHRRERTSADVELTTALAIRDADRGAATAKMAIGGVLAAIGLGLLVQLAVS